MSSVAIVVALLPLWSNNALADCSTNTPSSGETVICTPEGGVDTIGINNSAADNVTVEMRGAGATIRPANSTSGIILGAGVDLRMEAETLIDTQNYGVFVEDDAAMAVDGNILSSGKGRAAINAGDRLLLTIGETAELGAAGQGGSGVDAGLDADITLGGTILVTGETTDLDFFRGGAGIEATDNARVTVTPTGSIETLGSGTIGIDVRSNSTVVMDGTIVTRGGPVLGTLLSIFPAGIEAQQGAEIVVGRTGRITTHGNYAAAIDLGGSVDPYENPTLGNIHVGGHLTTMGENAPGIGISAAFSVFDPNAVRSSPDAFINIAEGALVESHRWIGIQDTNSSFSRVPVNTTVRVAGSVIGAEDLGVSIYLAGGDDELILLPTYTLGGVVLASQPGGNPFDSPDETDTLTLDGAAGTNGQISFVRDGLGTFIGFENLRKVGQGEWTIDGEDYDETIYGEVAAGRLSVNAHLPFFPIQVNPGAVLGGTGTVSSILASGRVEPGSGGFHSTGSVDLISGATLGIVTDGTGRVPRLTSEGEVFLNDATLDVRMLPQDIEAGDGAIILAADFGVDGVFDTVVDNLPDIEVAPIYSPNDVRLSYRLGGDQVSDKGIHAETMSALLESEMGFAGSLRRRGAAETAVARTASVADAADTTISENAAARSPVVWIDGSAAGHSLDGPGDSGFDLAASGLTAGVELHGDLGGGAMTLGISGGYAKARIDAAHARADADIARLGAYVDWTQGPVSVSGALSYSRASIDTFRDVAGAATALSESDASLFAGSLEATYNLAEHMGLTDNVVVAPLATLDFAGIHRDGFAETGAGGLGLTAGKERAARALAGVGIRLGARHDIGGGWSVMPVVDLAYQRGFGDDEVTTALALPRFDADFAEVSAAVPRDRFAVGASLTITQGEHLSFSAGYKGAFGSGLSSHTGSVGLSYRF